MRGVAQVIMNGIENAAKHGREDNIDEAAAPAAIELVAAPRA